MFARDLVRIYRATVCAMARVLADKLSQAVITTRFLPSNQAIGVWKLEVGAEDVDRARAVPDELGRAGRGSGSSCYACDREFTRRCRLCDSRVCPEHALQSPTSRLLICITCSQAFDSAGQRR
jgi:hypothetical protein